MLAAIAGVLAAACGPGTPAGGVSADQVKAHAEARLVYPGGTDIDWFVAGATSGGTFVHAGRTGAYGEADFDVADPVDSVVAWYDHWLSTHDWQDAQIQGDDDRRWERGAHEDLVLDCSYQASTYRICHAVYSLDSDRFPPAFSAGPAFGSPVSLAAVQERHVGLAATEDRILYLSRQPIPDEGTPDADAARAKWATGWCCATPVLMQDTAQAEQAAPLRSAYHAIVLQVAEYDRPDIAGRALGSIERNETANLISSGFVLRRSGPSSLYTRGARETVIFSIVYGAPMWAGLGIKYRVATVSIVYDVAPKSCDLLRPDCLAVLFGVDV